MSLSYSFLCLLSTLGSKQRDGIESSEVLHLSLIFPFTTYRFYKICLFKKNNLGNIWKLLQNKLILLVVLNQRMSNLIY